MGDQFTTADILLTTCLTWAIDYGVGICDSAVPYLERTTARRAYLAAEKTNTPIDTMIAAARAQASVRNAPV